MKFNAGLGEKIVETLIKSIPEGGYFYLEYQGLDDVCCANEENNEIVELSDIKEALYKIDPTIEIHFGYSKVVITSPNLDGAVIKIPFKGYYTLLDHEYRFVSFDYAPIENHWNYCEYECKVYKYMVDCGFGDFFAEIAYFASLGNFDCYIQEYVASKATIGLPSISDKSIYKAADFCAEVGQDLFDDFNWLGFCIETYGEEIVYYFLQLFEEDEMLNECIMSDLHSKNYGQRMSGTPCILDYCGFFD